MIPLPPRNAAPEEEPEVRECASCLWELNEDSAIPPVVEGGDEKCLACSAEEDAADIVLAEVRHGFTPTRSIGERTRAVEVMRLVLARAEQRIAKDAEHEVALLRRAS